MVFIMLLKHNTTLPTGFAVRPRGDITVFTVVLSNRNLDRAVRFSEWFVGLAGTC
jgi:hypothetical protein